MDMETQMLNKEYVVRKINYYNEKCGEDKKYFIKVFIDIYTDGIFEIIKIEGQLTQPERLAGYNYYNDYWILSNKVKVVINEDLLNDHICWIVDDELNMTNENYFIMEKEIFDNKYSQFITKLYKLFDNGFSFFQIKFLFNEFIKEPIDIL